MLPAIASAPAVEAPADVLAAYAVHLARTGRGNIAYERAARAFLRRWPQVQGWADVALRARLAAGTSTRPFITFLLVSRRLRPGYDYLLARKLSSFWRDIAGSPLRGDLMQIPGRPRERGWLTPTQMPPESASQSIGRSLSRPARNSTTLTLVPTSMSCAEACRQPGERGGQGWRHYHAALSCGATGSFSIWRSSRTPPPHWQGPESFEQRIWPR